MYGYTYIHKYVHTHCIYTVTEQSTCYPQSPVHLVEFSSSTNVVVGKRLNARIIALHRRVELYYIILRASMACSLEIEMVNKIINAERENENEIMSQL